MEMCYFYGKTNERLYASTPLALAKVITDKYHESMQNTHLKYIGMALIGVILILIFLLLNSRLTIYKLRIESQAQKEIASQLSTELANTLQTLDFFYFNIFEIRATSANCVVAIGDTLEASVGVFAMNHIFDDETEKLIEPIILLAAGVDDDGKMLGPFDTIPVSHWEGHIRKKATEIGTHEIFGTYQFPDKYNFKGTYSFSMKYTVIE